MSIDLTKLTPAPWKMHRCKFAGQDEACGIFNDESLDCSMDECHHPLTETDAAFIAIARNAFDVMMRRGWHAKKCSEGPHWFVDIGPEWIQHVFVDKRGTIEAVYGLDPFTALVAADEWYKANVEKS